MPSNGCGDSPPSSETSSEYASVTHALSPRKPPESLGAAVAGTCNPYASSPVLKDPPAGYVLAGQMNLGSINIPALNSANLSKFLIAYCASHAI